MDSRCLCSLDAKLYLHIVFYVVLDGPDIAFIFNIFCRSLTLFHIGRIQSSFRICEHSVFRKHSVKICTLSLRVRIYTT